MTDKQAPASMLAHYNALRQAKGYALVHPEDWRGVRVAQARELIAKWTVIAPAAH